MSGRGTVVVVGAGAAGVQAASSLRELGWSGRVVVLGGEADTPYQRPPLSKGFLADPGKRPTGLRAEGHYASADIELRTGVRVVAVEREHARVRLADGTAVPYDALVLATGARNRIPPVPGLAEAAGSDLRALDDAVTLRRRLAEAGSVAVIGGGAVGMEVAASAVGLGKRVTVVEALERPLSRMASARTAAHLQQLHESWGTTFLLGAPVTAVEPGHGRSVLRTGDGRSAEADLLVVAVGVVPDTGLAAAAGLEVSDGVVVGPQLRTSDPRVFAIGDCARFPTPFAPGGATVRLESVQNALDQGRHVARVLTGGSALYTEVPWFWSDQGPVKLQVAGLPQSHDEEVLLGDPGAGRWTLLLFRCGELVAGESLNRPLDHLALRRLFADGRPLSPAEARRPDFDLRACAQPVPAAS